MEQVKKLLKISGILKCIMGVLLLEIPGYGGFLILCGVLLFLLSQREDKDIIKYNFLNIVIGVLGIVDIVGSIIQFINFDKIIRVKNTNSNAPPKVKYQVNQEQKKLDYLLKLGVGMVFIAGVLFATTSWDFITDYLKVIFLVVFGFGFLGLAIFSEEKLKLYRSSYLYWTLSMAFFILSVVAIFYFQLFGTIVSYLGYASSIAYAITYFTIAGFSLITYFKYPKKIFLYCTFAMLFLMICSICLYFNVSSIVILCIISTIVLFLNIFNHKSELIRLFSYLLSFILFAFMIYVDNTNDLVFILTSIINIINLHYYVFKDSKKEDSLLHSIVGYSFILILSFRVDFFGEWSYLIAGLGFTLYTLMIFTKMIPISLKYHKFLLILYTIFMGIFIFSSYDTYYIIVLALLSFLLLEALHFGLLDMNQDYYISGIEPIMIFYLIFSILRCYTNYSMQFDSDEVFLYCSSICSILYCICHKFYHSNIDKKSYFYGIVILNVIVLLMNTEYTYLFSAILIIISSLYIFAVTYLKSIEDKTYRYKMLGCYILLLFSVYFPFVYSNILDLNGYFLTAFMILILVMISFILKDQAITKLSCLFVILPFSNMIHIMNMDYVWEQLLGNILSLYIVLFVLYFYIKNTFTQNVIYIIALSVFCTNLMMLDDIVINVYIGILGLATIIFGYQKKAYYPIFITGIVVTVLNILHSLRDVWDMIPFWFYLLLGGLFIILFVTCIEIKKKKKSEEKSLNK